MNRLGKRIGSKIKNLMCKMSRMHWQSAFEFVDYMRLKKADHIEDHLFYCVLCSFKGIQHPLNCMLNTIPFIIFCLKEFHFYFCFYHSILSWFFQAALSESLVF